jgi:phage/plasmid-like protein (TIGR03299 family)
MSKQTIEWLNTNVLVGMTDARGNAWHYRQSAQGTESNHYAGAIPIEDVRRRLFSWDAVPARVAVEVAATMENATHLSDDGVPLRWAVQEDRKAITASDDGTVFEMFKSGYTSHQYSEWLLSNVGTILDGDLGISSAGLLSNRGVAWVEVGVPETIKGPAGVDFRPNLVACTSHDGTLSTTYKRTVTATVCDNTLAAALGEKGQTVKVKHSKYSGLRITDARVALAMVTETADAFADQVRRLTDWKVGPLQLKTVINALVPVPDETGRAKTIAEKKQGEILALLANDLRVQPWAGTAFGVVQAFNTWTHHIKGTRGNDGGGRAERNMLSALDGSTDKSDAMVLSVLAATNV